MFKMSETAESEPMAINPPVDGEGGDDCKYV